MAAARPIALLEATSGPLAAVWRGQALAGRTGAVRPSGHAPLDAQLPGGGWPLDAMTELLQAHPDDPFWQLLLPALAAALADAKGPVVMVAPPHAPFSPALAAQGVPADRLLCIRAARPAARLWAAEQALRCADVPAVLAWLPQVRDDEMRRLQLAGADRPRLLFAFRPLQAEAAGSPARLRLALQPEGDALSVRIVKRRGPPLVAPLLLPARAARLQALLAARAGGGGAAGPVPSGPAPSGTDKVVALPALPRIPFLAALASRRLAEPQDHALDRSAAP